jgi:hypothetical protein
MEDRGDGVRLSEVDEEEVAGQEKDESSAYSATSGLRLDWEWITSIIH